ncbi:MAG: hypothetical protein ACK5HS_01725 [Mycoplasmatales bacterium]
MFDNRSKVVFVSFVLGALYTIYLLCYFSGAIAGSDGSAEAVGASLAATLVAPHMFAVLIATAFNGIAFFTNKKWAIIVALCTYIGAGILFLLYIVFVIPMIVLSAIGISKISNLNKRETNE